MHTRFKDNRAHTHTDTLVVTMNRLNESALPNANFCAFFPLYAHLSVAFAAHLHDNAARGTANRRGVERERVVQLLEFIWVQLWYIVCLFMKFVN